MSRLVVDASVVAKLFFPETHSAAAVRAVKAATELLAPELIWAELASVIWKRVVRGEIDEDQGRHIINEILRMPVHTHSLNLLADSALQLAISTQRSVYDCLYLALAIHEDCVFLTADERLFNALAGGTFSKHVRLLGRRR